MIRTDDSMSHISVFKQDLVGLHTLSSLPRSCITDFFVLIPIPKLESSPQNKSSNAESLSL